MDENKSWYLQKNIDEFGSDDSDPYDEQFQESNKMSCKHQHYDCTWLITPWRWIYSYFTALPYTYACVFVFVCFLLAVNGFMYGNLPELELCNGDHVVWHLLGLGSVDLFGIYFQGNTFQLDKTTRDTLSLFPHSSVTVSMTPDNDGNRIRVYISKWRHKTLMKWNINITCH